jgi:ATP-binding cassette subfamily F protein 3
MELRRVAPSTATAGELRSFLAKFLFTGDDVYKHVRDLSGGEKGRLALAKLIYSRVNVLILDEPTNHLDIPSREALEEALDAYQGTIITISHDRYFLDRVATQILALDGAGNVEHYDGDYTEYHDWKAATRSAVQEASRDAQAKEQKERSVAVIEKPSASSAAVKEKPAAGKNKTSKSKRGGKQPARDSQLIESEIADAEARLATLSDQLALPEVARDPSRLRSINDDYQQTDARLRSLYEEWDRVATEAANS